MADQRFEFKKSFNSNTLRGRANVAKVTWASLGLIYIYAKAHRQNAKRREESKYCQGCQKKINSKR